ncbi:MAG: C4-dicarboxylate ABC transporter substrate-binding protein, partial [bacterium]|nr:C4-dicarboxylate ABC transporter substrate-binding protein [bacterium]
MHKILCSLLFAAFSLGVFFDKAEAQEWKFNNGLPEGRNESQQLNTFAEDVAELSGGEFTIKVFHGGSLNLKDNDVVRWLPGGAVEMGLVWANYLGRDAPALNAVLVQGSVGSSEELLKVLPAIQEIYKEELAEWGIAPTGFMALPLLKASIFCRDEPVRTLDDLRTKKLRVWSNDQVETFSKLGVSAQIVGQNDLYVALQTGVVDCAVYPALFAHTISLQEVADYASYLYPIASVPYVLGANQDA